ncbi:TrmH family RNA methyltransferase [Seonamhaeicola aphaedonensis]|uniref:TrmH family RNA methyltransferase n=1 Tax=Seonamhaeicola aphaedonensis TaxID=1461338 RepID=A0A3D9H9B9_9FLAO|nr:RNA methyltransferase [Seonamhaeicola aphaedonensis]RED46077.1 TrmH family RNA methyltransferase [Seonamhaeicola aphaedonensis]
MKIIRSTHNTFIKQLIQLKDKSRERKKKGLFLVEGAREISLAIKGGYQLETVLFYPELFSNEQLNELTNQQINTIEISKEVYQKLAYRDTTEGVIAVAKTKNHSLDDLHFNTEKPLLLVVEAPEKPGNIGALLRTADAANVDAVIIANPKTDLYNPNIIRSSVGCVFTKQIAMGTTPEVISFLKEKHFNIYCAALQASVEYTTQDFTKSSAIVVGTEATGLSDEWLNNANQNIIIPMQGEIDSMNVSVAAGILIFEAKRQRNLK